MYIATSHGGIWRTENNGISWTPIFDDQPNLSINAMVLDPSNPKVIWVGTGSHFNTDVTRGAGVVRSRDGGKTWENLGLAETEFIGAIAVHPKDPNTVLVGGFGSHAKPSEHRGVYRTSDGGKTWTRTLFTNEWSGAVDVKFDPANPDVVYATMFHHAYTMETYVSAGPGSGIFKSIDGGRTWKKLTQGLPKAQLGETYVAVSPSKPNIVYALVDAKGNYFGPPDPHAAGIAVYRSEDSGETWTRGADMFGFFGWIEVDPVDANRIYVAGIRLMTSDDGGRTLRNINSNSHADTRSLWIDPTDRNHIVMGNDGGLWTTYDRGQRWFTYANLPVQLIYQLGFDMRDPYNVYAGMMDNGVWGMPSRTRNDIGPLASDAFKIAEGDGFYVRADPVDTTVVYGDAGYLYRVNLRTGKQTMIRPRAKESGEDPWGWNPPFLISPHNHRTLYTGAHYIYRSTNRGDSWTIVSPLLSKPKSDSVTYAGATLKRWLIDQKAWTLDESPVLKGLLYAGFTDGRLHVTRDAGKSWRTIDSFPGAPVGTVVSRVIASHRHAGTAYVALNGAINGDYHAYAYKTTDYGATWRSIASNLPDAGVFIVIEHLRQPDLLFAGTERGVYFSTTGGRHWRSLRNNMPIVSARDLAIHPRENDLIVGTWGRGIWVLDDITPLQELARAERGGRPHLFSVRSSERFEPRETLARDQIPHYSVFNPPFGALITYYIPPGVNRSAQLSITNAAGTVIRQLTVTGSPGVHRAVWDLRSHIKIDSTGTQGSGKLVEAGRYTVSLSLGNERHTTPITVREDPRKNRHENPSRSQ
jgi:photosystem II stability/assembly factor-like uncharacterized protein